MANGRACVRVEGVASRSMAPAVASRSSSHDRGWRSYRSDRERVRNARTLHTPPHRPTRRLTRHVSAAGFQSNFDFVDVHRDSPMPQMASHAEIRKENCGNFQHYCNVYTVGYRLSLTLIYRVVECELGATRNIVRVRFVGIYLHILLIRNKYLSYNTLAMTNKAQGERDSERASACYFYLYTSSFPILSK